MAGASERPERWTRASVYPDMWLDPADDPRDTGVSPDGELPTLQDYLNHFRLTLLMKCDGLDAEQLARRPVPPSTMSLLGLVRHLAEVERDWRGWILPGDPPSKLYGARVITTASSDEKLAKALELGADETINYTRDDWPKEVKRLTNGRGVDVVFEHTGAATWPGSILSLKKGGRLVTCGATSGFDARTDLRHVFYRHLTILGSMMGSKADLLTEMKFIESGQIRAVIDRTLPLPEARQAHELMEDRAQFGKLVLTRQT